MARAKKQSAPALALPEAQARHELITDVIETNYMPYAMSVIISRAIPEIDGFKPVHRKLLYTMYTMGLMTGNRTKSTNIVGTTMKLHPHGDAAIYETMVRLTRGNESLLHPFVDSKGSFGKQYSRDMAFAAARYTEAKLDPFCAEIFGGVDKNAVDMVPNYDNTLKEPALLPTSFPNILVSPNMGIAVGMASNICSFNLGEICDATIALLRHPNTTTDTLLDLVKGPDFPGGAYIIYDREAMRQVYETGRGPVKLRARYSYDKEANCIDITQIPYSTSIEAIMGKIADAVKSGKIKDIIDVRDEIDLSGFKLTIDLRRGTDPDKLMTKLYKLTPLEDSFDCNFNVLIDGSPRQLGIKGILTEWIRFRTNCVKREFTFELGKKKDKLHLLLGLGKILLDIDKAVAIVRNTAKESEVVPNLMEAFHIDEIQAEYIAEIKLRHLNKEYILNRLEEIKQLQEDIAHLEELIADELKLKAEIAKQLAEIKKKYAKPRKTQLISADEIQVATAEDFFENYNARILLTKEGYFKKITLVSLRGSDEQKLKEGDRVAFTEDCDNTAEMLFITDQRQMYRARVRDFDPVKASALGDFLPAKLGMADGERPIFMKVITPDLEKYNMIYIFENGKGVRISLANYQFRSSRKKLSGVYSDASPIVAAILEDKPKDVILVSDQNKAITLKSALIPEKTTRTAGGVTLFTLKGKATVVYADEVEKSIYENPQNYRKIKIPATGSAM
ncbi:MAG: topoisomerase IV [Clostridia bacterium]|nr:topoisomerase IV [Clostridia bacterium]